jgi:hypothetical protein
LAGVGAADCISNTHPVYPDLVHSLIYRQEIDQVRTERILRREADFDVFGLYEVDNFDCRFGDVCHILSMREFAEERGSANDYVDTVNAWRGNLWSGYKMVLILKMV